MRNKLIVLTIVILIMISYAIGSYFVDFALKRVDPNDINSGPPACENIHDKSFTFSEMPNFPNEIWTITSRDGLKLNATHYSPETPEEHYWVILVHGYGRDQRYARDFAEEYLERGYNVLTPDLRASGTSEGIYLTMGARESDDILIWIDKILGVDAKARIVLHGVSMGAATVMMAAAKSQSLNLAAVIEDCGFTSAYNMFTDQLKKIFGLPEFPIMNFVDVVSKIKTGVAVSDAAPIISVANSKIPTLFIHGDADKLVPFEMLDKLYNASASPVKEKFVVEGAGHADSKIKDPPKYFQRIFNFIDYHSD